MPYITGPTCFRKGLRIPAGRPFFIRDDELESAISGGFALFDKGDGEDNPGGVTPSQTGMTEEEITALLKSLGSLNLGPLQEEAAKLGIPWTTDDTKAIIADKIRLHFETAE